MAIATLTIDIVAKLASLQTGFDRAAQLAERNSRRIENAFRNVGTVLKSAVAGFGVQQIVQAFNATADGLAQFKDVAESTGIAVEELSKLEPVARGAGLALSDVGSLSQRLSRALTGVDDESRGAGKALAQIGIELARFRTLGAAEQLQELARALAQYADDGNKAAIAQAILGRAGAEALPFLKDLAEAGKLVATVTAEQARQADEWNKNLVRLQDNIRGVARAGTSELIPLLNRLVEGFRRVDWGRIGEMTTLADPFGGIREYFRQAERIRAAIPREQLQQTADELERLFNLGGKDRPSIGPFIAAAEQGTRRVAKATEELARVTLEYEASLRRAREEEGNRRGVEEINAAADAYKRLQDEIERVAELTGRAQADRLVADLALIDDYFFSGKISVEEYDNAIRRVTGATSELAQESERSMNMARELGLTFSSAFEDAIVEGGKLSDVLRGLEKDIVRIITRKLVTEPLANAIGKFDFASLFGNLFSGFLGGARAVGGPVTAGMPYLIGERGPEIFVPRQSGDIIPNGRGVGNTINITVAGNATRETASQIAAQVSRSLALANARGFA